MNEQKNDNKERQVRSKNIKGTIILILAIIFFSGLLSSVHNWASALDFITLSGKFGTIKATGETFMGAGGSGARAGFLLAISLVPSVMLAMGVVAIVEQTGGLKIAQKALTPVLRPLLGLPGNVGLALISSLQSTDAGAGMTKSLYDEGKINEKERTIFVQFQLSGAAAINNYLTLGSAVFTSIVVPVITPFILILVLKILGANVTRFVLNKYYKEEA